MQCTTIHNFASKSEHFSELNLIPLLLEKTNLLSSVHFSCLSAVHNHETVCGILQFNTLMLNSGEEV